MVVFIYCHAWSKHGKWSSHLQCCCLSTCSLTRHDRPNLDFSGYIFMFVGIWLMGTLTADLRQIPDATCVRLQGLESGGQILQNQCPLGSASVLLATNSLPCRCLFLRLGYHVRDRYNDVTLPMLKTKHD